jgi:glycosyltransferase involved in cell wall biosynthesis
MAKKKIVHLLRMDGWGGTERALQNYLNHASSDTEHIIISSSVVGENAREQISAPMFEVEHPYPDSNLADTQRDIAARVEQIQPDLIVSWMSHCHKFSGAISEQTGIPAVWYELTAYKLSEIESSRSREIFRENAANSATIPNTVLFCSERAKETLVGEGYDAGNAEVIPLSVDTARFRPDAEGRAALRAQWGVDDTTPVIGMVARFDPLKDVEGFLKAARQMKEQLLWERQVAAVAGEEYPLPMPHFVLCGFGMEESNAQLKAWVEENNLTDIVHLHGISHDMPAVYSALDIVASPSQTESFGLTCIEGMACGTPFVGTDVGAYREMVGELGKIVPPRPVSVPAAEWDYTPTVEAWQQMIRQIQEAGREQVVNATVARAADYDNAVIARQLDARLHAEMERGKRWERADTLIASVPARR